MYIHITPFKYRARSNYIRPFLLLSTLELYFLHHLHIYSKMYSTSTKKCVPLNPTGEITKYVFLFSVRERELISMMFIPPDSGTQTPISIGQFHLV